MDRIETSFANYREDIELDAQLKEEIRAITREWEKCFQQMLSNIQKVQRKPTTEQNETIRLVKEQLPEVKNSYKDLAKSVSGSEYFKYHDLFRFMNTRMSYVVAFVHYLKEGTLVSKEKTAVELGIAADSKDGFYLDLEDYLYGILDLARDLSRLAVNSVTVGDCKRPVVIRDFLTDLDSGFRMLNLKNDGLRKRFDALKYDVKKSEEIVYDLTIRQLKDTKSDVQ